VAAIDWQAGLGRFCSRPRGGTDEKTTTRNAYVEIRDGIVTNAWRT